MSALAQPRLTLHEYLAMDRAAELRSEFYDGEIYAMAGGSQQHAQIIANLLRHLFAQLADGPCQAYTSDLRVLAGKLATYPDISVVCGESQFLDGDADTLTNPHFVIEVLSPSTERHDRGLKSAAYRTISSLVGYALISPNEARVEVYARQTDGRWVLTEFIGLDAECRFDPLGIQVAMGKIYSKVLPYPLSPSSNP